MNIYEKLNKINDNESLSEKYNVKNAKELKKLQESSSVKLRAGRQQKLETFMDYINDKAIELGFDINPATEAHVLTNQRRNIYLSWNYFVGDPQIVLSVSLAKNGGYIVSAALGENWIYPLPSYDFEPSEKSEQEVYEIIDELLSSQMQTKKESLKEGTYSNRVEGNNRYFDTMGNKIRYCLLDVIRSKGYTALYMYMKSLDPVAFSAYAPDFTTKLGELYQDESVDINRADTFGKIADDLQQQFIKMVSKVDSKKHSVYEDKTPEELWNNSPVEIDGEHNAKVQNFKKKFGID